MKAKILGWLKQQQIENEYRKLNIFLRRCLESQFCQRSGNQFSNERVLKAHKKRVQNAKEKLIIIYFNLNLCAQWRLSLSSLAISLILCSFRRRFLATNFSFSVVCFVILFLG
jgi:hypothetical protein